MRKIVWLLVWVSNVGSLFAAEYRFPIVIVQYAPGGRSEYIYEQGKTTIRDLKGKIARDYTYYVGKKYAQDHDGERDPKRMIITNGLVDDLPDTAILGGKGPLQKMQHESSLVLQRSQRPEGLIVDDRWAREPEYDEDVYDQVPADQEVEDQAQREPVPEYGAGVGTRWNTYFPQDRGL